MKQMTREATVSTTSTRPVFAPHDAVWRAASNGFVEDSLRARRGNAAHGALLCGNAILWIAGARQIFKEEQIVMGPPGWHGGTWASAFVHCLAPTRHPEEEETGP